MTRTAKTKDTTWTTSQAKAVKNAFTDEEYAEYTALASQGSNVPRQNEILRAVLKRISL